MRKRTSLSPCLPAWMAVVEGCERWWREKGEGLRIGGTAPRV